MPGARISSPGRKQLVFMAVTSKSKAENCVEALKPLLETYGFVVLYAPVSVVRGSKFN